MSIDDNFVARLNKRWILTTLCIKVGYYQTCGIHC